METPKKSMYIFLAHPVEQWSPYTAEVILLSDVNEKDAMQKVRAVVSLKGKYAVYWKGVMPREDAMQVLEIQPVILNMPSEPAPEQKPMDYETLGQLLADNTDKHSWVVSKKV